MIEFLQAIVKETSRYSSNKGIIYPYISEPSEEEEEKAAIQEVEQKSKYFKMSINFFYLYLKQRFTIFSWY